tara:strand:+ start:4926 stop:5555 length:630 start_codon:yes stop_codon:yes gene_type:complete
MKSFDKILKSLVLGSLTTLFNKDSSAKIIHENFESLDNKVDLSSEPKKDLSLKLKINFNDNGEVEYSNHRSHRSHQSHRSHYSSNSGHHSHFSHYSSSTGGTSGGNSVGGSYYNPGGSYNNTYNSSPIGYSLGSRTIKKGMSGKDVTEVINILLKTQYLTMKDGSKKAYGSYTYEGVLYEQVKRFQKDVGLNADGIIGPKTIYYLKKYE